MGTSKPLDKEINQYLSMLNDRQKNAVLTVVKTFAEGGETHDHWKDETFVAELDRRTADYESGKAILFTIDELEANAIKAHEPGGAEK